MQEKILQEAAIWLWKNKDNAEWWTHVVLTSANPDVRTLGLKNNMAFQIFTILEERRLIIPIIVERDNKLFQAYKINFDKEKEWKDLIITKSIWKLYICPFLKYCFKKWWLFIFWVLSLIIAGSLQTFCDIMVKKLCKFIE